ncbi:MAG TPA: PIN domain-containing protein [Acidobacteriaceae bacterium]
MGDLFLLDTNGVSDIIKDRSPAIRQKVLATRRAGDLVAISVLSHAEIRFGFAKNPAASRLRAAFDIFLHETPVLPWTEQVSESYAQLRLQLGMGGRVVDTLDLLIASHAHALGATLVTRDKGFRHLQELVHIVNWATDLN